MFDNSNNSEQHIEALEINELALLDLLRRLKITAVTVNYEGSGDRGKVTGIQMTPYGMASEPLRQPLMMQYVVTMCDEDGHARRELRENSVTLERALEDFTLSWVNLEHPGWQANKGSGAVTIDVMTGRTQLAHWHCYVQISHFGNFL